MKLCTVILSIFLFSHLGPHTVVDISFSNVCSEDSHTFNFMINNAFFIYY
jgi:hypothetical protein